MRFEVFEDWMKYHCHYRKWVDNMRKIKLKTEQEAHDYVPRGGDAISGSFAWTETKEGYDYWLSVSTAWMTYWNEDSVKRAKLKLKAGEKIENNLFEL